MRAVDKALFDVNFLQSISQDILKQAKEEGADQAEVGVAVNKGFSVAAHDGEVETVEYNQDKSIDITVYFGKRTGSASLSDVRPEAIKAAVQAACHIAKFTDEDPAAGLVEKDELAFNYPQLDLFHPWHISVEEAIQLAIECEKEAMAFDGRILSADESTVATIEALDLYANSHGFVGYYPYTRHDISCVLVAKQGKDMQRDYSYTVASNAKELKSVSDVAREAATRTVKRLGARRIKTTKAPVIFAAEEARGLLGYFAAAISGSRLYRKASFLLDKLDTQVFPEFVHLEEQPHLLGALGSSPFDEDGVATRNNVFVENGILRQYSLGAYSARKMGMKSTGNAGGMHNLTIKTGDKDLPALLKTMGRGLLITEMMGNGVNLLTGDYSRGVGGYWVENGEIQYPVHEVTVAGTLQDMYARMREVGKDVDVRGNVRTGSILLEEMMIAGD